METIPDDAIIYRAISNKRWITDNKPSPAAFLLRNRENEEPERELSVITDSNCSKLLCLAGLNTCLGELVLKAVDIRELGLDTILDPKPPANSPYHAFIINIPICIDENLKEAERIAGLLAKKVIAIKLRQK
jgi:hypothetical protein